MTRLKVAAVLVAAAAAAGAGCGGDDGSKGSSSSSGSTAPTASSGQTDRVSLVDFEIKAKRDTVKAGKTTFAVSNDGQAPHALEIEGNGKEVETETLEPGKSAKLTVDLKPGTYKWYCPVGDHAQQGMTGRLTVK